MLRDLVLKDKWLKLASLVAAICIYLTVSAAIRKEGSPIISPGIGTQMRFFDNLPVLVVSSAADVRSFRVSPDKVSVTVRGETGAVDSLQARDLHAMVDLSGVQSASNLVQRVEVSTPPGITLVRVDPEAVVVVGVSPQ